MRWRSTSKRSPTHSDSAEYASTGYGRRAWCPESSGSGGHIRDLQASHWGVGRDYRDMHAKKSTHHAPPTNPKREKGTRQPNHPTSKVASSGASAPPVRAPIHIMPLARPRLSGWNHSPIARARAGKAPLRRAEEESDDDETLEVPNEPCKPREDGPKSDNPGEHPALPQAVGQPSGGDFGNSISHGKNTEGISHLNFGEFQCNDDAGSGNRNTDAIEISDSRSQGEQDENAIAQRDVESLRHIGGI